MNLENLYIRFITVTHIDKVCYNTDVRYAKSGRTCASFDCGSPSATPI